MNQLNVFLLWISLWISVRILTTIFCSINLFKYLIKLYFFFLYYIKLLFLFIHPLPSPTLYGYLDSGTSDTEEGMLLLHMPEYGDSASEKHPLLYFLPKGSQHHQPQFKIIGFLFQFQSLFKYLCFFSVFY